MRKALTTAIAAVTAAGAVLATAAPAQADGHRRYYHHGGHHHGGGDGDEVAAAIIGGVAGLALGAAIAGNNTNRTRASSGYYQNGYAYDPRYDSYRGGYYRYSEPRYRTCISRERVYDPYLDRPVTIERRYAC